MLIKFKTVNQKTYDTNRNVSVIKDTDGNSIVVINDKIFKGQDKKDWKEVEKYLIQFVGKCYEVFRKMI